MKQILKTSKQWYDEILKDEEIYILDPDGWDRTNYEYSFNEELITHAEFQKRLSMSTVLYGDECSGNKLFDIINENSSNPIKFQDTAIYFNTVDSHNNIIINPNSNICISEAPEDNSHGDLVSLVWLIEKLRRREGGCIMNELIDEAKKHFSGLQYIKKNQ